MGIELTEEGPAEVACTHFKCGRCGHSFASCSFGAPVTPKLEFSSTLTLESFSGPTAALQELPHFLELFLSQNFPILVQCGCEKATYQLVSCSNGNNVCFRRQRFEFFQLIRIFCSVNKNVDLRVRLRSDSLQSRASEC